MDVFVVAGDEDIADAVEAGIFRDYQQRPGEVADPIDRGGAFEDFAGRDFGRAADDNKRCNRLAETREPSLYVSGFEVGGDADEPVGAEVEFFGELLQEFEAAIDKFFVDARGQLITRSRGHFEDVDEVDIHSQRERHIGGVAGRICGIGGEVDRDDNGSHRRDIMDEQ